MNVKTEYRMVAVILTPSSLGDGVMHRRLAAKNQLNHASFGMVLCKVVPPRGEPTQRMVSQLVYPPLDARKSEWRTYTDALVYAMKKPTLFSEDFDRQYVVW